jgi:hypothetical protein
MKGTVAVCVAVVLFALLATPETAAAQCAMCRRASIRQKAST